MLIDNTIVDDSANVRDL